MNEITFEVLRLVIIISTLIIVRYLLPYLKLKIATVQDNLIWKNVLREVKSVQQFMKKSGDEKKLEVAKRIIEYTNKKGYKITEEEIFNLIETAVWVMKYEDKYND